MTRKRSVPRVEASPRLEAEFKPKTKGQVEYVKCVEEHVVNFISGPAGVGKTLLATYLASSWLLEGKFDKIVVVRPAIEACGGGRNRSLGFLPGGIDTKLSPYLQPTINYFMTFFGKDKYHKLVHERKIEYHALEFCRGMTWDRTVVLAEEFQSANLEQIKMIVTRLGRDSKIICSGDPEQSDVRRSNSEFGTDFEYVMDKIERAGIEKFGIVRLGYCDILRNDFIQDFLNILR